MRNDSVAAGAAVEALLRMVAAATLPQPLTALDLARMQAMRVTHLATQLQVVIHSAPQIIANTACLAEQQHCDFRHAWQGAP